MGAERPAHEHPHEAASFMPVHSRVVLGVTTRMVDILRGTTSLLFHVFRLEITEQVFKRLLIFVIVFPVGEVRDVVFSYLGC